MNDNTTPMAAVEYDAKINATIPYYSEFYEQTLDVVEQCGYAHFEWLDLGCGTGTLEQLVLQKFPSAQFTAVDPSEKMLEQAKGKLRGYDVEFVLSTSEDISYSDRFNVVTAIQSHHYLCEDARKKAVANVYKALKEDGIFICFENVVPEEETTKKRELLRWGRYQQRHGKTEAEAQAHNARCGVNYFPLTVSGHITLLKRIGFREVHVFWLSYMQMGIYAVK